MGANAALKPKQLTQVAIIIKRLLGRAPAEVLEARCGENGATQFMYGHWPTSCTHFTDSTWNATGLVRVPAVAAQARIPNPMHIAIAIRQHNDADNLRTAMRVAKAELKIYEHLSYWRYWNQQGVETTFESTHR